ncbi:MULTISPECIES: ABC transporter ATP-binding protein [unclassified Micromonospora]|uniref:ABC transporter ATP-binding protein n=1 Tax=unclassified Micromonospora TaxID=2617518 RepID=UPI001034750D|nr:MULTISPECIES: energy-coupling factor transporter ATPase [unclassified Micromonospora]QKW13674.1 ATP-binding cassette domain-containing protein [Verrucosispora sp. NA02020]TBL45565.1 energy-coupling factor ABC transporter ATP-binding protein [Verrucosispora sp. SN26_14.1]
MSSSLTAQQLGFTYRRSSTAALTGVDLRLPPQQFTALLGAAGAGKSTLAMALTGLIPRSVRGRREGTVHLDGRDLAELAAAEVAQHIGIVFQDFESQLFATSVTLELAFGLENLAVETTEMRQRVEDYLRLLRLTELRDREPATLSGGQKQRLALAAALALEPEILILDEPTTDLDAASRVEVIRAARWWRGRPRTLVLVEHDTEAVLGPPGGPGADRVVLLEAGQVAVDGPADTVLRDPALLRRHGVRPPQVADVCDRLGLPEIALTVAEAVPLIGSLRPSAGPARARGAPGPAVVSARHLDHEYPDGRAQALRDVSVDIHEGQFTAIMGRNGSGKTTLAKVLSGLLVPDAGQVDVLGRDLRGLPRADLARHVGYVFQNPDHQLFSATVADEIAFGPRNFGLPDDEVRDRVDAALADVGLTELRRTDPFLLRKGDRQRLAVAAVLAMSPRVIVLDEPTTGLDERQQQAVMRLLRRLNRADLTVVMVTHHANLVAEYADRLVVMTDGRIVLDGPPEVVFRRRDVLAAASVLPPPVVDLADELRVDALTVDELAAVLRVGR